MKNSDNPARGAHFESKVKRFFSKQGLALESNFAVPVGFGREKKEHRFDLGSAMPPVIVECKCHTWTAGGNSPSAKLTNWNEAMLYFSLAHSRYRKIFVAQRSLRGSISLANHYLERYGHLIPRDVEIWEIGPRSSRRLRPPS